MREKSPSIMGVSGRPKSYTNSALMSTRAKEAGKRGLEDVEGAPSMENKKKTPPGNTSVPGLSAEKNPRSKLGGNPPPPPSGSDCQTSHPQDEIEDNRPVDKSTLNNHVATLMNKLDSIEGITVTLNREVASIFTKLDDQSGRIRNTEDSVANHEHQIGELKKKNSHLTQQLGEMKKRQSTMIQEVNSNVGEQMQSFKESLRKDNEIFRAEIINHTNKSVERATSSVKEDFIEEQSQSRKNNLILMGLPEVAEDTSELVQVRALFTNTLGISGVKIADSFRLGKPGGTGPRPLLVKFKTWADRKRVWFAKSKLKDDPTRKIWLQEDMPKPMKEAQRALYQSFKKAKSMSNTFKSVQLRGTKLILDGTAYGDKDLESLPFSLRPQSMATRQSETVVVFFGRASPLSNHHPSPFQLEGHKFSTMEQFLAWRRAKLSGKKALINRALSSNNPVVCKGILNELRNDNTAKWDEILDEVVLSGLKAKFSQNPNLAQFLIATYPKTLGEASLNKKWGIGLPLNSQEALDMSKWGEGGNLLGKKLSQIREELRS